METKFSKSWNEFIESEEGKKCSEPEFGSISNKFLINRLHAAFSAGWNANNLENENKIENLKEASEIVTAFYKMNESGKQLHEVLPEIQKMIDGYKTEKVKSDASFIKGKIEGLEEAKWQLGYALPHIDPNGRLEKQTRYLLDVFNKVQDELLREVEKVVGSTKIAESGGEN